jgi:hypothetical protein
MPRSIYQSRCMVFSITADEWRRVTEESGERQKVKDKSQIVVFVHGPGVTAGNRTRASKIP